MKSQYRHFILLIVMFFSAFLGKAQEKDYCIIHIINKSLPVSIYFNDKLIVGLSKNEVLKYKMYSKGSFTLTGLYPYSKAILNVNVEDTNDKYLIVTTAGGAPGGAGVCKNLEKEKWIEQEIKSVGIVSKEEDVNNPWGKIDNSKKSGSGQGTCFVLSSSGYLITNYHVIENVKEITVKGIDGDFTTKYGASVVASDPSNDLALLKIGNKNIKFDSPPFAIRSSGVAQAEKAYALGFPAAEAMGQEVKITEGIISSKSGAGNDISKFQISAAVNHGNSGGPLIDEQGNLIGVIYAKSTIAESAGYAVKASYLETFLKNVDGFEFPNLTNTIKDKPLTEKVAALKNFIFIVETN